MSLFGTGRKEGVLAVIVLLALVLAARAPTLWSGSGSDGGQGTVHALTGEVDETNLNERVILPGLQAAGRTWRGGEFPRWNPDQHMGVPFSLSGASVFYPPFWLLMGPEPDDWLPWVLALHGALAAGGMYRFLRSQRLSRYAAFVGGGFFGLGWFLTAQEGRLQEFAAAAWLPLLLEGAWRVLTTRARDPWGCLLAVAAAAPFLTGAHAVAWLNAMLALAMVVCHAHLLERSERSHTLRTTLVAVTLTAGLTAPVWLEAVQYWGHLTPLQTTAPSLPTAGLMAGLAPGVTPLFAQGQPLHDWAPGADVLEFALFPGSAVLFLLMMALLRGKLGAGTGFWGTVAALGLAMTLCWPGSSWVVETLRLHVPSGAFLLWTHLGLIVLATRGLENFLDNPLRRAWAVPATAAWTGLSVLGVVIVGYLLAPESNEALRALRLPLLTTASTTLVLGLLFCAWRRLGILRFKNLLAVVLMGELVLTSWIHRHALEVHTTNPPGSTLHAAAQPAPPGPQRPDRAALVDLGDRARPQASPTLNGPGLGLLDATVDLVRTIQPDLIDDRPRPAIRPLAGMDGVDGRALLAAAINMVWSPAPVYTERFATPAARPGGGVRGDLRPTPAQRLWPVARANVRFDAALAESTQDAVDKLHTVDMDQQVVLQLGDTATPTFVRPDQPADVKIVGDRANSVEIEVETYGGEGVLVLADAWAPGWIAEVDGKRRPVLRANIGCRAVAVHGDDAHVEFRYEPWSATWGPWIALTAAGLLALWGLGCATGVVRPPRFA